MESLICKDASCIEVYVENGFLFFNNVMHEQRLVACFESVGELAVRRVVKFVLQKKTPRPKGEEFELKFLKTT